MSGFSHIDTWVFDLDNTLYPSSCRLFDQMHVRMADFIKLTFNVDDAEAMRRRRHYFQKYGTTLRGLMLEHDMQPDQFLDYVHDIDYAAVPHLTDLQTALQRLPGRKLVFTNGTRGHATRVMDRLGVTDIFEAIYDIADAGYIPKPARAPYEAFALRHEFATTRAAMFEDMVENLEVPHALGMTTVLITAESHDDSHEQDHNAPYVHHKTQDLARFLGEINL